MINEIVKNLKDLTLAELEKLQESIVKERGLKEKKQSIYTHDCYGSSDYHFGKYKHYSKKITAIDSTKTNGYAFSGEFLQLRNENLVPEGSYVIEACSCKLRIYRVDNDLKELILEGSSSSYVSFIREAKELTGL